MKAPADTISDRNILAKKFPKNVVLVSRFC